MITELIQAYLDKLRASLPELPSDAIARLGATYGLERREVETLISLDEYNGAGIIYFEEVSDGKVELGRKASNW